MLNLPERGFSSSVRSHNCRVDIAADWIEGSALLKQQRVSRSDILDNLCENHVYHEQEFAAVFLADVWVELRHRARFGGIAPLLIQAKAVEPQTDWSVNFAYSFCLLLSLCEWYPSWARKNVTSYIEQGELFERQAERSLIARGWRLLRTGWSATHVNKLSTVVGSVSSHLGEPIIRGGIGRWTTVDAKDAGLDLVCERPFRDSRGGRPLFFFQCASGANWSQKTRTPDLRLWKKLIDFTNDPQRGFALPYALPDQEFRHTCGSVNGMVLDRLRLAYPNEDQEAEWISDDLRTELNEWMSPKVETLPSDS